MSIEWVKVPKGVDAFKLLRGGGQGGNHAPVGDAAQRVLRIEHHENDDEDDVMKTPLLTLTRPKSP